MVRTECFLVGLVVWFFFFFWRSFGQMTDLFSGILFSFSFPFSLFQMDVYLVHFCWTVSFLPLFQEQKEKEDSWGEKSRGWGGRHRRWGWDRGQAADLFGVFFFFLSPPSLSKQAVPVWDRQWLSFSFILGPKSELSHCLDLSRC